MSTLLLLLAAMLACILIAGWLVWRSLRLRARLSQAQSFSGATSRKLTADERAAVENYIESLARTQNIVGPSGASAAPAKLVLNSLSNTALSLTRSITRYGLSTDDPNKWRYYLDSIEVHLPPFWEQYITNDNYVELIRTETMPLVISLNGHTLIDYSSENRGFALEQDPHTQASIRGEESEQIELLNIRQETPEEYALSRPDGLREAILICVAFIMLFLCLVTPPVVLPWLVGGAFMLLAASLWGLFAPPAKNTLREVHCLRGTPKRWGLFGESNQDQINNISFGIIDLIYPAHWQPYVAQDLGQKTDIDIYLDRNVLRQGRFLSLHDEVRNFPIQHWVRNLVIASGSLIVLLMLTLWVPLEMPLKLSISWLKGAQTIEATTVADLNKTALRVGDTLKVNGTGMCNIHTPGNYITRQTYPFTPFDCSQIVWNTAQSLPVPESDIMDKATALTQAVSGQIHPQTSEDSKVNPQLRDAIQKSGMVLLDDFAGIVLKTQALCTAADECVRLKNALVNLGNTKDWDALTKKADSGKLTGVNVLLRPVSAESLDNLVTTSTAPFFIRETARAAQALNSPAPAGYVIINDEGSDMVDQPLPPVPLYDIPAQEQWGEFQRLAEMLLKTPFSAEGIITGIKQDANGTQHITLHKIPDSSSLWRYISTTLLLICMIACLLINGVLAIRRFRRSRSRLAQIQQYYDNCMNPSLTTISAVRPLF